MKASMDQFHLLANPTQETFEAVQDKELALKDLALTEDSEKARSFTDLWGNPEITEKYLNPTVEGQTLRLHESLRGEMSSLGTGRTHSLLYTIMQLEEDKHHKVYVDMINQATSE